MAKNDLIKFENVYFAFTSIAEPKYKYQSKIEKEFGTTIVLSREQSKEFKKLKLNKTVKEVDTSEFEEKFKFSPPYPEQDEQYVIVVNKRATYKDGNPTPAFTHPKAYFVENRTVVENNSILIGNGSFGNVSLETTYNEALKQTNVNLYSVLIKTLVPYAKRSSGDEWASEGEIVAAAPVATPVVTSTPSANPPVDLDDDLPF